ncbi:MAG: hypothetical protein HY000_31640 [Planctomycetes bacterium]|nr:hypothetical protein [Planctomycetota bacterium]
MSRGIFEEKARLTKGETLTKSTPPAAAEPSLSVGSVMDVGQLTVQTEITWSFDHVGRTIIPKTATCIRLDPKSAVPFSNKVGKPHVYPAQKILKVGPSAIAIIKRGIKGNYFCGVADLITGAIHLCPLTPNPLLDGSKWYPTDTIEEQQVYFQQWKSQGGWVDPVKQISPYRPQVRIRDGVWSNPITHVDVNARRNAGPTSATAGMASHEHIAKLANPALAGEYGAFVGFTVYLKKGNAIHLHSFTSRSQNNQAFDKLVDPTEWVKEAEPGPLPAATGDAQKDKSNFERWQARTKAFQSRAMEVARLRVPKGERLLVHQEQGNIGYKWAKMIIRSLAAAQFFDGAIDATAVRPAAARPKADGPTDQMAYIVNP